MFSLELIARKTKVVTNKFFGERRTVCEKRQNGKIETKFTSCSDAVLKLIYQCLHFAYFMTLNSAFKYLNLWQFVILC